MFKLRPYQQHLVDENKRLWSEGVRNPCTVLSTGGGKCHRKGTPILMYDGTIKNVEEVVEGDVLMGPNSDPKTVLKLGRGSEMMYCVTPVKGEPYYVNESHILSLRKRGTITNMSVVEYLTLSRSQKKLHYGWKVPGVLQGNTRWVKAYIKSVEPVGVEPYYGFEIDGDHLYLLGDFTVTHNTVVAAELIRQEQQAGGYFAAIAHRQELVGQISLALARQGVMHDIVAPRPVIRFCSNLHVEEVGQSFYSQHAPGFVGGVNTVIRRDLKRIKDVVSLVFQDECHHVLRDNLWGKAAALFPQANGLYVTATPLRADGKGLGRHADGLFDQFIFGPPMRQLIREGSLTDYKIYAPPTDIDLTAMKFGSDGDFSRPELVKRAKKSGIVGDVVTNYAKYCNGVQTVVFVVDVEQAHEVADTLNASGVKAVALSANNTDAERQEAISAFKRKEIQVIVNVDLLGEGFDCPAIECVIMARPTASYGLYSQQFGRAIRILEGKQFGLIVDMVGNVKRHGLPDAPREWSLDRREKRGKSDAGAAAVKTCPECMGVYAVGPSSCPYCGHTPVVGSGGRGDLVLVDADLRELTPEELADMRGEADKLSKEWNVPYGGTKVQMMAAISHNKTVVAQRELREAVALYAGAFRAMGVPDEMIHLQIWKSFGTNVSTLQTLRPKEANALRERIMNDLNSLGVTG